MTYELTNAEKQGIVEQHIKNLEYSLYNLEMSLLAENAVASPDADSVSKLTASISNAEAKKTALLAELDSITE